MAGIFEKFTEKAIKAVMLAQNFAQKMGAFEVSTPVLNATCVTILPRAWRQYWAWDLIVCNDSKEYPMPTIIPVELVLSCADLSRVSLPWPAF